MGFVVILKQPGRLPEPSQRHKELYALIPGNRSVVVVVHYEYGGLDIGCEEHRRVLDVQIQPSFVPKALAYAALSIFILGNAAVSRLPAYASVGTGHIPHRGSCAGCGEHIGTGHQICCLVSSPALSLDGHLAAVDEGELLTHRLRSGTDAVVCAFARMSRSIHHVGNKYHIAVAHKHGNIDDGAAGGWCAIVIQSLGVLLVEVYHHRV